MVRIVGKKRNWWLELSGEEGTRIKQSWRWNGRAKILPSFRRVNDVLNYTSKGLLFYTSFICSLLPIHLELSQHCFLHCDTWWILWMTLTLVVFIKKKNLYMCFEYQSGKIVFFFNHQWDGMALVCQWINSFKEFQTFPEVGKCALFRQTVTPHHNTQLVLIGTVRYLP